METREPFDLPYIDKKEKHELKKYVALAKKMIRMQAVKVLDNRATDFDEDFKKLIDLIWQDGYSRGLMDMDRMHATLNKEDELD
jgi:hypothetical protein